MKQLVISLIFLTTVSAFSQTVQGTTTLAGGFEYTDGNSTSSSSETFGVSLDFGQFIADDVLLALQYQYLSTKIPSSFGENAVTANAIGLYVRKYFHTSKDEFAFFAQPGIQYAFGKQESGTFEVKNSAFAIYLSPGFSYFFTPNWAVDLAFTGIQFVNVDPDKDVDDDEDSSFELGLNSLSPSGISIRYFFSRN